MTHFFKYDVVKLQTPKLSFGNQIKHKELATLYMRTVMFAGGEFFHVYNRGVDKRKIFMDDPDHVRFIRSLAEFNNVLCDPTGTSFLRNRSSIGELKMPLVRIHSYCLMPNHFHLLLEQVEEDGISRFMHRLGTGYTKYFNLKYDRTGCLLESTFKARHLVTTDDFTHVSRYIHLNPLDLFDPLWKESPRILNKTLENMVVSYPWSSLSFFTCSPEDDEDTIVDNQRLLEVFQSRLAYRKFVFDWTHNRNPVFKHVSEA